MQTKVEAARIATSAGVVTAVTAADRVIEILRGDDVGTVFLPIGVRGRSRRLWLEHATTARGRLIVDDGAVAALIHRKKSLLPAGITDVEGTFHDGDPVDVCAPDGTPVARGLVNYSSAELPGLLGRSTRDLAKELGPEYEREVIHRDDLVLL
jgi:glutamate 5-kinase